MKEKNYDAARLNSAENRIPYPYISSAEPTRVFAGFSYVDFARVWQEFGDYCRHSCKITRSHPANTGAMRSGAFMRSAFFAAHFWSIGMDKHSQHTGPGCRSPPSFLVFPSAPENQKTIRRMNNVKEIFQME
jgi:hypothetical protein